MRKKIFLSSILGIALFCITYETKSQSDTLSFLHITDTHLIFDLDQHHPEIISRRKHYGFGQEPLKNILDSVAKSRDLRFVAITGDMIDFYAATTPEGKFKYYQIEQFAELINQYPVKIYLNPGNHDIATYAWGGTNMLSSQRSAGKARAAWARSTDAFRNGTHYSHQFNVGKRPYRLIFLDNAYNSAGNLEKSKPPYLDRVQMEWLKEQLTESNEDTEIVLMHIPLGDNMVDSELYDLLTQHPSLKLILAGHEHVNQIRKLGSNQLTQVQTGAFARDPHNWRKVSLTENAVIISTSGDRKVEIKIELE